MTGLLHHLKSYRRISTPSDLESTYLFENSFELTSLANTRLPFHMLLQTNHFFWKIICEWHKKQSYCFLCMSSHPAVLYLRRYMYKIELDNFIKGGCGVKFLIPCVLS